MNGDLRPYQQEAVDAAMRHDGFLLALEQRTGKTRIALEVVRRRSPDRLLILCPKIAINEIWWKEIEEWEQFPETEIQVMTFEGASIVRKKLKRWLESGERPMVIGDEIQKAKKGGRGSRRGRASASFARVARWTLGLSGTPFDKPHDLWGVFEFVDPDLFGTWGEFRDRYCTMGGWMGRKIIGYKNQDELHRLVDSRMHRVLLHDVQSVKTQVNLPIRVRFQLKESLNHYRKLETEFMTEVNGRRVVAARAMSLAMKLHQCTGGALIASDKSVQWFGREKEKALDRLLHRLPSARVVVFARFIHEVDDIEALFKRRGTTVTAIKGRKPFIGFKTDAAVCQIQSGVAIDLADCPVAIFYSWDYSHLNHEQARFRIQSYDRSPEVSYYYLVGWGTIDEDLYEIVHTKQSMSTFLLDKYRQRKNP